MGLCMSVKYCTLIEKTINDNIVFISELCSFQCPSDHLKSVHTQDDKLVTVVLIAHLVLSGPNLFSKVKSLLVA